MKYSFSPRGEVLFLASPSKSTQKEGDPTTAYSLRCSTCWAAIANSSRKALDFKQPLAEIPHQACATRRGRRGGKGQHRVKFYGRWFNLPSSLRGGRSRRGNPCSVTIFANIACRKKLDYGAQWQKIDLSILNHNIREFRAMI